MGPSARSRIAHSRYHNGESDSRCREQQGILGFLSAIVGNGNFGAAKWMRIETGDVRTEKDGRNTMPGFV
jgi:hypothetical protein